MSRGKRTISSSPSGKTLTQQQSLIKNFFGEVKNVVTKFAFATRMGYIPNNPFKQN
jgi:hypothetical protein